MYSCVFLEFNFSFDLGRQENSSSSFASWDEVHAWCVFSHMCAQLYILPARAAAPSPLPPPCKSKPASHPRSHYFFACAPPTKTPPPSARSSFSLALCADDKMCPRGFETFSLRERTRDCCLCLPAAERNQRDNKSAASSSAAADNFQRRALRNF
jgi:hypothetical protein